MGCLNGLLKNNVVPYILHNPSLPVVVYTCGPHVCEQSSVLLPNVSKAHIAKQGQCAQCRVYSAVCSVYSEVCTVYSALCSACSAYSAVCSVYNEVSTVYSEVCTVDRGLRQLTGI